MGRIKDKVKYPIKVNPKLSDYFIGSDSDRDGTTVNFEIAAVVSTIKGAGEQDRIISGYPSWIPNTLSYQVPVITYFLSGSLYTTEPTLITLDNGGALPRIDVIAVSTESEVVVFKGEESASPTKPSFPSSTDYLELTFVNVAAGATVPTDATSQTVYDEGAGEPNEYTVTENTSGNGITLNYSVPDVANTGAKVIRVLRGTLANGTISFVNNTSIPYDATDHFQIAIEKHEVFASDIKFEMSLWNAGVEVTSKITINSPIFGFDNNLVNEYQVLTIPFFNFIPPIVQFDRVDIKITNIPYSEVWLDSFYHISGVVLPSPIVGDIPVKTSELINDGEDGTSPYTTFQDLEDALVGIEAVPDATTTVKGKLKLAGDLGGTADLPTTPTAVHKTGNETVSGTKTFNNTSTPTTLSLINGPTSGGILSLTNSGNNFAFTGTNAGTASLIRLTATSTGSIFTADATGASNPFLFVGQNSGTNTFTVNKLGDTTAAKFVKSGAVGTNILLADGTDIAQTTFEKTANKGIANGYASLDSGGKVPVSQLPNSVMEYKGTYDASTNTPTLIDGIGNTGDVYKVTVAGSGVNGLNFAVGDYAIYNGSTWEKAHSGADAVSSVFGRTGAVLAVNGDYNTGLVTEVTNKRYQTDAQNTNNDATSPIQAQLNARELIANKQNNLSIYDGTGTKYVGKDGFDDWARKLARVSTKTGLVDKTDTFNLTALSNTILRIEPITTAVFWNELIVPSTSPSNAIKIFAQKDYSLTDLVTATGGNVNLTPLTTDGKYIRYIGYDKSGNVYSSPNSFLTNNDILQLGFVTVLKVGSAVTFLDGTVGPRNVFAQPNLAANTDYDKVTATSTSISCTPNVGASLATNNGAITGISVNWKSPSNPLNSDSIDVFPYTGVATAAFRSINPLYLAGTAALSTHTLWTELEDGIAINAKFFNTATQTSGTMANGSASLKRILVGIRGGIYVQDAEFATTACYADLATAKSNIYTHKFSEAFSPTGVTFEIARVAYVKGATAFQDTTQFYLVNTASTGSGGSSTIPPVSDATTVSKGILKLAGDFDLTSTADVPIIGTLSKASGVSVAGDMSFANGKGFILNQTGTNRSGKLYNSSTTDNQTYLNYYPNSGTNVSSTLAITPKGTGFNSIDKAQIAVFNTDFVSNPTNYEFITLKARGNDFIIASSKGGTGSIRPILISSGGADNTTNQNQLWFYTDGRVGINTTSNNGVDHLQVNGSFTATSVKKTGATTTNILLAGGGDIPQSTFQTALTNPITGLLTAGYVPKATAGSSLSNSLIFDDATNISIGATSANARLSINNGTGGNQLEFVRGTGRILFNQSVNEHKLLLYGGAVGSETLYQTWLANGNVGIGTTNPLTKLSVVSGPLSDDTIPAVGSVGGKFSLLNDNGNYGLLVGGLGNGKFFSQVQRVDGTADVYDYLLQPNGGNVGIGTATPNYKLDVEGDIALPYGSVIRAKNYTYNKLIETGYDATLDRDFVNIYTAGVSSGNANPKITILRDGNVGIGTVTPTAKLNVFGSGAVIFAQGSTNVGDISIAAGDAMANGRTAFLGWRYNGGNPYGFVETFAGATPLVLQSGGGNVGIGTVTPNYKLHIKTSSGANYIQVDTTDVSNTGVIYSTNGTIKWYTQNDVTNDKYSLLNSSNSPVLNVLQNGNVGIGTANPNEKLDVAGNIKSSSLAGTGTRVVTADASGVLSTSASILPYKVYTALISQNGTSAPTAVVLENTLGLSVTWSFTATGSYTATVPSATFTLNKTQCFITNGTLSGFFNTYASSNTTVTVISKNTAGSFANGTLDLASFEIRVYP